MFRRVPFFFFQAEDGIRDLYVTGVQTCALPIYAHRETPLVRAPAGSRDERGLLRRRRGLGRPAPLDGKPHRAFGDRKSVVKGKSVDLGGRRLTEKIKKDASNGRLSH